MDGFDNWAFREYAFYLPKLDRVIRKRNKEKENLLFNEKEIEVFTKNNKPGHYASIMRYKEGGVLRDDAVQWGPVFFDFDSEDIDEARQQTRKALDFLSSFIDEDQIEIFFTGAKGFHLEIHPLVFSIDPQVRLADSFRDVANYIKEHLELSCLDMVVYNARRMWRLNNTQHQKTQLFKVQLPPTALDTDGKKICEYAQAPRPYTSSVPRFNLKACQWFRTRLSEAEYDKEQREIKQREFKAEQFSRYGTSLLKPNDRYIDMTFRDVFAKIEQAGEGERNVTLYKQSFRLYCLAEKASLPVERVTMLLTATALSIGLQEHEVQATLTSALRSARKVIKEES